MSEQQQCPHCGAKSCFKNVPDSGFFGCGSTDLHGRFFQSKNCLRNQLRAAEARAEVAEKKLDKLTKTAQEIADRHLPARKMKHLLMRLVPTESIVELEKVLAEQEGAKNE